MLIHKALERLKVPPTMLAQMEVAVFAGEVCCMLWSATVGTMIMPAMMAMPSASAKILPLSFKAYLLSAGCEAILAGSLAGMQAYGDEVARHRLLQVFRGLPLVSQV